MSISTMQKAYACSTKSKPVSPCASGRRRLGGVCLKHDNRGSTLLTVIICLAFVSVMGIVILSAVMTNLNMKLVDSKSKKSFYSSEVVLDKLRVAVQETLAESIRNVYEDEILTNYAYYLSYDEDYKNDRIQKMVAARFVVLAADADDADSYEAILARASGGEGYLVNMEKFVEKEYLTEEERRMINTPGLVFETEGEANHLLRLKDIRVEYDDEGYRTAISTDIVVNIPKFSFGELIDETQYKLDQPFRQYVLMAEGRLVSDNISGSSNITGNVFAGGGIYINGKNSGSHSVNIKGGLIASDNDIVVSDTATLNIEAVEPSSPYPVVWAQNLFTLTSDAYSAASSLKTGLNIDGITVIKDDLSLEGRNSDVTLKGAYIGYTGGNSSKASSILVNGAGSRLDLRGLTDLILAGRAKVMVQDAKLGRETEILTGESLAIKSNQRAYLLPGSFIMGVNHNPLTPEDYLAGAIPQVLINDDEFEFSKYISRQNPYIIAAKQTGDTVLRYYYLNFDRGWKADAFFKDYYDRYKASGFFDNLAPFDLDEVLLPDIENIKAVGNLMSYSRETGMQLTPGMSMTEGLGANPDAGYDEVKEAELDLALNKAIANIILNKEQYAGTILNKAYLASLNSIYYNSIKRVNSIIKEGGASYLAHQSSFAPVSPYFNDYKFSSSLGAMVEYKNSDPGRQSFWIIDGDVTISGTSGSPVFNGILIATGNVTIKDNAIVEGIIISSCEKEGSSGVLLGSHVKVKGRIISRGDIYLGQACQLLADESVDNMLDEQIFRHESDILRHIFKGSEWQVKYSLESPLFNVVDLNNMISYDKWRRIG